MRDINKLHPSIVLSLKPAEKDYKISDGGGLYLLVKPNGSRYWRLNYRHEGKQKTAALGVFPSISLAQARIKRDSFDPVPVSSFSLKTVFEDYLRVRKGDMSPRYQSTVYARVSPVLEALGSRPVDQIKPMDVLPVLRQIEQRSSHVVHKVRSDFSQCYSFAVASGLAEVNPFLQLSGALKPLKEGHRPAVLDPKQIGKLLAFINGDPACGVIPRLYLQILPYVFTRPGELRLAKWCDIDLRSKRWVYKMGKVGTDLIVPLSPQVVNLFKELKKVTGGREYAFASVPSDRPISDMTCTQILRRSGWSKKHSLHGWRAVARTLLVERLRYPVDIVEQQLGHVVKDALGRAYNRTQFLDDRAKMMRAWSDYLSSLVSSYSRSTRKGSE